MATLAWTSIKKGTEFLKDQMKISVVGTTASAIGLILVAASLALYFGTETTELSLFNYALDQAGPVSKLTKCSTNDTKCNQANFGLGKLSEAADSFLQCMHPDMTGHSSESSLLVAHKLLQTIQKSNPNLVIQSLKPNDLSESDRAMLAWVAANYLIEVAPVNHSSSSSSKDPVGLLALGGDTANILYERPVGEKETDLSLKEITDMCYGIDEALKRHSALLIQKNAAKGKVEHSTERPATEHKESTTEKPAADHKESTTEKPKENSNNEHSTHEKHSDTEKSDHESGHHRQRRSSSAVDTNGVEKSDVDVKPQSDQIEDPCANPGVVRYVNGSDLLTSTCLQDASGKPPAHNYIDVDSNYKFVGTGNNEECDKLVRTLTDVKECEKHFSVCPKLDTKPLPSEAKFLAIWQYYSATRVIPTLRDTDQISYFEFKKSADTWCEIPKVKIEDQSEKICQNSFENCTRFCFTLKLIESLLSDIYHFEVKQWDKIYFTNKVDHEKIDWTFGATLVKCNTLTGLNPISTMIPLWAFIVMIVVGVVAVAGGSVACYRARKARASYESV